MPSWLLLIVFAVIAFCLDTYVTMPPPLHIICKIVWIICGVLGGVLLLIALLQMAGVPIPS